MNGRSLVRAGFAAAILMAGGAVAQPWTALAKVQPGYWQFKEVGAPGVRLLCLADPAMALQIGHGDAACKRSSIENGATTLTVRYSCTGSGHGRSTLTIRTGNAFRLQTQGLASGAPFDFDYEAKRLGDCPATPSPAAAPTPASASH